MDNENSVIYGLEFQARALAPQLAEIEKVRFLIGTQSLKQANNQIHLIEFNEEVSTIKTSVFHHSEGEIWKITTSPLDPFKLATCYNSVSSESNCSMKTSIRKLPENENRDVIENLEIVTTLDIANFGNDIKTTEFHPTESNTAISLTDTQIVLWDISESEATETHLKTYDIRSGDLAWSIDNAHSQLVRDLDYNMNKQYHLATCGDDAFMKIWDFRQTSMPVFSRSDHSHWVWCVRFNHFHDQLLLTASSDARVLLSSAASVSSENVNELALTDESEGLETKQMIKDGPLQWCEHEDSVYCAEWSPAEPWVFASLSYDGRLLISHVKKSLKYQIML
ncbi:hypothetical protein JTB14_020842 [Gonioctena quinquepunctata]|nr:hypothetical protein JTB14_020842 [Gonioctena quinquepunctata]